MAEFRRTISRSPRLFLFAGVASALLLLSGSPCASAQTRQEVRDILRKASQKVGQKTEGLPSFKLLAMLADKRITESSGLAVSWITPGVLWTHNDSGDGSYLFAIDRSGHTLARVTIPGATNVDWEDLAIGPGIAGKPTLYIGDIGDNNANRHDTVLYRVPEPRVDTGKRMQEFSAAQAERFPFRYPDGSHNAETLLVHPVSGEVTIVAKEESGVCGVYAFPSPMTPGATVVLKKIGSVTFSSVMPGIIGRAERLTTGGSFSPDGKRFVIRTYLAAYEWHLKPGQSVGDALKAAPRHLVLPLARQGESICYSRDGRALLSTSEGLPTPLYETIPPK